MAKYSKDDCRNNSERIKNGTAMSTAFFIIETMKTNRHERRREKAMEGRKNTVGVPLGFNHRTWAKYCAIKEAR